MINVDALGGRLKLTQCVHRRSRDEPVACARSDGTFGETDGLSVVATFLAALVARASRTNVLFVVISFPLLLPLLLSAIAATVRSSRSAEGSTCGEGSW